MAFVYSEPRWIQSKSKFTPGPGSHSPEILQAISSNMNAQNKPKIRKGKAFINVSKEQQVRVHSSASQSPQLSAKHQLLLKNNRSKQNKYRSKIATCKISKNSLKQLQTDSQMENKGSQTPNQLPSQTNHFLQISKLEPGIFLQLKDQLSSIQKSESFENCKADQQVIAEVVENIKSKKYAPSIKNVCKQNFYIGSKDQYKKNRKSEFSIKNKVSNKQKKGKRLINSNRMYHNQFKSGLEKSIDQQELDLSLEKHNRQKQSKRTRISNPAYLTKNKSMSRNRNIHKQILQLSNQSKYEERQTGIEDQNSEEVSEFVQDAVPGPGSYQISNFNQSTKKSMMFTQTNKDRFKAERVQNQQMLFFYQKPHTNIGKSRASQRRVGFGRSLTKPIRQADAVCQQNQSQFYQNYHTIQNVCMKLKLRDALNPGFFASKAARFAKTPKRQHHQNINVQKAQQSLMQKAKKNYAQNKQTYQFISEVKREANIQQLTSNVNFTGQQHRTIQKELYELMSQPKYYQIGEQQKNTKQNQKQNENILVTNTLITYNTNKFQKPQYQKRVKSEIQIKHQLVEDINGFRQRQNKITRKQDIRGYTFNTNFDDDALRQVNPGPVQYHHQASWVKTSFNTNFMGKQPQDTMKHNQSRCHGIVHKKFTASQVHGSHGIDLIIQNKHQIRG